RLAARYDEPSVAGASEVSVHEKPGERRLGRVPIEVPEARGLWNREAQSGHLVELAADPAKKQFRCSWAHELDSLETLHIEQTNTCEPAPAQSVISDSHQNR